MLPVLVLALAAALMEPPANEPAPSLLGAAAAPAELGAAATPVAPGAALSGSPSDPVAPSAPVPMPATATAAAGDATSDAARAALGANLLVPRSLRPRATPPFLAPHGSGYYNAWRIIDWTGVGVFATIAAVSLSTALGAIGGGNARTGGWALMLAMPTGALAVGLGVRAQEHREMLDRFDAGLAVAPAD